MGLISIIIPVLNEKNMLAACGERLQPLRRHGCELIIVDGGSSDGSSRIAEQCADRMLVVPKGRAVQMNAGARVAGGDIFWFLHVDSWVPVGAETAIRQALTPAGHCWGCFDIALSGAHPLLRIVETSMNVRSRLTGIATGDQGIFVRREVFGAVAGYPEIALMEDIALSRVLRQVARPVRLSQRIVTSSRRWEEHGILKTIVLMWRLRWAYYWGADPQRLARIYYREQ
jgi:rSAM/selenodomain-associated transferase 2